VPGPAEAAGDFQFYLLDSGGQEVGGSSCTGC